MHRFQPQCVLEAEMLERLAAILWRLRRVPSFEVAIVEAREIQCSELGRLPDWQSDNEEIEEELSPETAFHCDRRGTHPRFSVRRHAEEAVTS